MKPERLFIVTAILATGGVIWWAWHMHNVAREIAQEWLTQHRYKVISVKAGLFGSFRFGPRLFRNEDRSHHFRCVVEDRQLGGQGVVWLRVWTDRMGLIAREPDVDWEIHPHDPSDTAFIPVEDRLELIQRELLRRIKRGETSFAAPTRPREGEMPFDELVEHLRAMQKRGLIAISTPQRARTPGSVYEFVEFAELTDEGRVYLNRID